MLLEGYHLHRELLAARIALRIAELRVLAAKTFVRRPDEECFPLPGPAPQVRRPRPIGGPAIHRRPGGDGHPSS
jgi:hypothetical protein